MYDDVRPAIHIRVRSDREHKHPFGGRLVVCREHVGLCDLALLLRARALAAFSGAYSMSLDPILDPSSDRLQLFPIRYPDLWQAYKNTVASFWTVEEVDLSHDMAHWEGLKEDEKRLIKRVLGYFAQADNIVVDNLVSRFTHDVQIPEARAFYTYQAFAESIHAEMYNALIDTYVRDPAEKHELFRAPHVVPAIGAKTRWAQKWINDSDSFAERLVAFAACEGIHFSASFATIFYLKKRGLMPGCCLANSFIAKDEGAHTDFACLLYRHLREPLKQTRVHEIIGEATEVEMAFVDDALPVGVIGLTADLLKEYVRFVADRLIIALGCDAKYGAKCSLDYMEQISLQEKSNFFENLPTSYAKAGVASESKREIEFDADF